MQRKHPAFAFLIGIWLLANAAFAQEPLSLAEATQKTLANHPSFRSFELREDALAGERETAALRPALEVGIEAENFAGSGALEGFDEAELTVSMSSVIQLGAKRQARLESIDARGGFLQTEQRAQTLDLLGAMTRQFITVLALQERRAIALESSALAAATTETVKTRVEAGAAPDAELLRVQALGSQTDLLVARIERELNVAQVKLAAFWGQTDRRAVAAEGDLFASGNVVTFERLYDRATQSPAMLVYASEERLKDAEINLARARGRPDLKWSLGVREIEGIDERALVASLEMPLFAGRRGRGDVKRATAERNIVGVRRDQALTELFARLFDAYETRTQNVAAVKTLRTQTIPALTKALESTRGAYERGRYSYLDLIAAQRALIDAKATLIDAASAALQAGVIIEQLTGTSLQSNDGGQWQSKEYAP